MFRNEDNNMSADSQYVEHLENLITEKLLPAYTKYYSLLGQRAPDLDLPTQLKMKSKVAALFLPKKK
jgi:hypothetical protein